MSNKTYDRIKYIGLIFMPALEVLIIALTEIWNFLHGMQIAATVAAIGTFLGLLVKRSSDKYAKAVEAEEVDAGNEVE